MQSKTHTWELLHIQGSIAEISNSQSSIDCFGSSEEADIVGGFIQDARRPGVGEERHQVQDGGDHPKDHQGAPSDKSPANRTVHRDGKVNAPGLCPDTSRHVVWSLSKTRVSCVLGPVIIKEQRYVSVRLIARTDIT